MQVPVQMRINSNVSVVKSEKKQSHFVFIYQLKIFLTTVIISHRIYPHYVLFCVADEH